jgi:predicted Zn-dependent protease
MSYSPRQQPTYGRSPYESQPHRRSSFSGLKLRLLIAGAIILFSVVTFYSKGQVNPVTGEKQRVHLSVKDEIVMGLQAVTSMGQTSMNREAQSHVDRVGFQLVDALEDRLAREGVDIPYPFEFHLLADGRTVNAFALPGGQIFITEALYRGLSGDGMLAHDGRLAGVLGHEVGHVLERHGAQRMAKGSLLQGIVGAAGVAGGDMNSSRAAAWAGNLVNMKYGRADELESDRWGVELMTLSGYNPEHMIAVMDVLEASAGGGAPPEFMSTHPRPENRRVYIKQIIDEKFPEGIPYGLE